MSIRLQLLAFGALVLGASAAPPSPLGARRADVVVYGATSGGIVAAISAKRAGATLLLVNPSRHLGGMVTGGLGMTDTGISASIGGMSRQFYRAMARHYATPDAWRWQTREAYLTDKNDVYGGLAPAAQEGDCWWFHEPSAAAATFRAMLAEAQVEVLSERPVRRVELHDRRIKVVHLADGTTLEGRVFIDASYEGDLMAAAGVRYRVGRESVAEYGERLAGVVPRELSTRKQWRADISPFDAEGRLLFGIQAGPRGNDGDGDRKVQAYNYRICLTDHPDNRRPIPRPAGYAPERYELLLRYIAASPGMTIFRGPSGVYRGDAILKLDRLPNRKTDLNDGGPFSTDFLGANWDYPDGDTATRRRIIQEHFDYTVGMLYFLGHDPRVPAPLRTEMLEWGLPKDEFPDDNNWSPQLYVRETRRMVGEHVMTVRDIEVDRRKPDSIGLASYPMDSHHVQRTADDGKVRNEGNPNDHTGPARPFEVPYRSILPRRTECENLLVTFCVSASHLAFASIRMEPVFMILSESAGVAAAQAARSRVPVQEVPPAVLQPLLLARQQRLRIEDAARR